MLIPYAISLLLTLFCSSLSANDVYTVDEYIDYLTTSHSKPKILNSKVSASQHAFTMANALTDWQISSALTSSHTEPYQSSSFSSKYVAIIGTNFGISRPVLSTGGALSFGMTQQRVSQSPLELNGVELSQGIYFQNAMTVSYTQPLLYGFLGEAYDLPILIASNNVNISELQSKESLEVFILEKLSIYIDWALSNELTELSFSRLQLARESYNQTKERVRVNLSEKIDLLRAESALERAHQLWLTQKATLKSFQFKLSSTLDDQSILLKTPKFELYDTVYIKKPSYIVVNRLRSMSAFSLNKVAIKKQLALSESKRNGTLNLVGSYDLLGGNTTFQDAQAYLNNNSSISLQYSRPLGDAQSIARVKKETEELKQFELDEHQIRIDLEAEILSLYTLIEEYKNILTTTLNQIMISQQQAKAEDRLYKQGRSSLDMVIQSQDHVLNSKLNYAKLSATYQKYVITYQALSDELLTAYEVEL